MKFSVDPAAEGAKANDDVNKGPTDEFYRIKALADKQYDMAVQGLSSAAANNVEDRKKIWQCVDTYQLALNLPTNCSECKFLIHKDLLKCYNQMESLS